MEKKQKYAASILAYRDGYTKHDLIFLQAEDIFKARTVAREQAMLLFPGFTPTVIVKTVDSACQSPL